MQITWALTTLFAAASVAGQELRQYISYEALKHDTVKCIPDDNKIENCYLKAGGFNKNYNRGCYIYTRCARMLLATEHALPDDRPAKEPAH
ncbi:hypothetical protein FZEAL_7849 [Fusarium zealandicum]|uniref:Uncharacterized protein n=1 Tax=Fusarium zealandicum TaxID=1053134 RepID=A0A8H4UFM6_9HYPO|nr:hypothetical protein FZEAL_7849 [Fusarium zealandicum]